MYRAGDVVRHGPTCETWVLACDEEDGRVLPAGYPECTAAAADCELVTAATDVDRVEMLRRVAHATGGHGASYRTSLAAEQFAKERHRERYTNT